MLKIYGFILSFFLIVIIFVRLPQDSAGLASFTDKSSVLGSPRSARRLLDFFTVVGIVLYLVIAFKLNLEHNSLM